MTPKVFLRLLEGIDDALGCGDLSDEICALAFRAVREETEACAKVAENWGDTPPNPGGRRAALAAEIRERKKRHHV